jgi:hypothetical protein
MPSCDSSSLTFSVGLAVTLVSVHGADFVAATLAAGAFFEDAAGLTLGNSTYGRSCDETDKND